MAAAQRFPAHVGIIMDGNGRWAQERGKIRTAGHLEGLKTAKTLAGAANRLGIKYLSYYVFSTENWSRAQSEVDFIMGLVIKYLREEFAFCVENKIRVRHAGDMNGLRDDVAAEIRAVCDKTRDFTGMQIILALNYGGRDEIIRAVRRAAADGAADALTASAVSRYLDNPDIPDPDLIIRTAGEQRMSNFLLWESAYAELYFSPVLWPDFTEADLQAALDDYALRERRYGKA